LPACACDIVLQLARRVALRCAADQGQRHGPGGRRAAGDAGDQRAL